MLLETTPSGTASSGSARLFMFVCAFGRIWSELEEVPITVLYMYQVTQSTKLETTQDYMRYMYDHTYYNPRYKLLPAAVIRDLYDGMHVRLQKYVNNDGGRFRI